MALYYLQGIGASRRERRRAKRVEKKEKRSEKKQARKSKRAAKKAARPGKGRRIKRVAIAPARVAFLGLVRINALKFASKLSAAYRKDPNRIKNFWLKLGGDWPSLKKTIEQGAKTKLNGIGAAGAGAAAVAAAAPVIIVLVPILKDLLRGTPELTPGEDSELTNTLNTAVKDVENDPNAKTIDDEDTDDEGGDMPKWVLPVALIGGGALLFLLPKKKK